MVARWQRGGQSKGQQGVTRAGAVWSSDRSMEVHMRNYGGAERNRPKAKRMTTWWWNRIKEHGKNHRTIRNGEVRNL